VFRVTIPKTMYKLDWNKLSFTMDPNVWTWLDSNIGERNYVLLNPFYANCTWHNDVRVTMNHDNVYIDFITQEDATLFQLTWY